MILSLYLTLMPVILAGIANMIFCKSSLLDSVNQPIDAGRLLGDGRRLFGANKTWKGFWGMVVWGLLAQLIWSFFLARQPDLEKLHLIYAHCPNKLATNFPLGILLGLAYVVFELPNSYLKRRLDISPGKTAKDAWKYPFILLDQIDSLIGILLVLHLYISLDWAQVIGLLLVGTLTHLGVNRLLYLAKLRQNRL
jgi:cytidylyltransferase family